MIKVISVGKKHQPWVEDGVKLYSKRLRQPWNIEWVLLPHSTKEGSMARQEESERIESRLNEHEFVILLDEVGDLYDSPALSELCQTAFSQGQSPVFIIGGAYGVSDELRQRASKVVSLSKLVFPHQLVRLILVEQIYRWQSIASGTSYHHQ